MQVITLRNIELGAHDLTKLLVSARKCKLNRWTAGRTAGIIIIVLPNTFHRKEKL